MGNCELVCVDDFISGELKKIKGLWAKQAQFKSLDAYDSVQSGEIHSLLDDCLFC